MNDVMQTLPQSSAVTHTIIDTAAEGALEAPPSLNECHERAHVRFAAITAQGARFPMVHNIW